MATTVSLNGVNYSVPAVGEGNWGTNLSAYLVALSTGVLQKAGGSFTLTADVDFGATYGLKSAYFSARSTGATSGFIRAANNTAISWRNAANSANLDLKVNASNVLEFNGTPITTLALGAADTVLRMNAGGTAYEYAKLSNANIDAAAAIAYSKLNLSTSIVNGDIAAAAAIAYSKLADGSACSVIGRSANSSGANASIAASTNNTVLKRVSDALTFDTIVNADINAAAAIVFTKMAALTASRAPVLNASGFIEASSVTAAELGYLSGVSSAIQTQLDGKVSDAGDTITGNIIMDNAKEIRFRELTSNGTHYIGLKAPDSVTADKTFVLPDGDGGANQVLKTDGLGNLGWATVAATVTTTRGDLIKRGASADERLAIGTANYILKSDGTDPSWGLIVNANVDAAAAIAYSKLNLATSIVNADISGSAAIAGSKLQAATDTNVGTINYYKESTFTPVWSTTGTSWTSLSMTLQYGKYTRIGNVVTFTLRVDISAAGTVGSPTGTLAITGLPHVNAASQATPVMVVSNNVNYNGTSAGSFGWILSGESRILIGANVDNGSYVDALAIDNGPGAARYIIISGSYLV